MMGTALFLWTLALLSAAAPASSDPYFMVVIPAVLHYPATEQFCVLLRSLPETVHLTVSLEMKLKNHTLLEKDVEAPGLYQCFEFQVPVFVPKKVHPAADEEVASVHVLIRKGDSVSFENRKKVMVKNRFTKHVIQTDKPFYRPGETVRFRIVTLDEKFKAIDTAIALVQLTDPNNNRIGQWTNVKRHQGIVDLSFPLASEASYGQYKINVGDSLDRDFGPRRGINAGFFTVEEYELPRFEATFDVPSLVTRSDDEVQLEVCGKYTYGKPVHGKVHLKVSRDVEFYYTKMHENTTLYDIEEEYEQQTDKTGCASFTVNATTLKLALQTGYSNTVDLSATLEEEGTGLTAEASSYITVVTKEVIVNFIKLNPFYKQGFPYAGKMQFSVNGEPLQNHTVYLTVDVNDTETHRTYVTDEQGKAYFSLDTTDWGSTMVSLRARESMEPVNQSDIYAMLIRGEAFNWLKPFYSESNSFLEIQQVEDTLPCGEDLEVWVDYILDRKELDPEAAHVDFQYLVVSKGKIVSSGVKQVPVEGQEEVLRGKFSLTLHISSDLAPLAWLLLSAVFADGEVAADVDVFPVEKCLKHQVAVNFPVQEESPGSKTSLQLEADPGSLCSVQALDKSVILKEDATLTPEMIYATPYAYQDHIVLGRGFDYRLEDFEPYPCQHPLLGPKSKRSLRVAPWYQSEADVYSLFKQLKLKVLTNTRVKKPVSCDLPHFETLRFSAFPGVPGSAGSEVLRRGQPIPEALMPQALDSESQPKVAEEKAKPRTHFPETWIWDLVPVGQEGKASHSVTVPDTITEWHAQAFCVAEAGFGLSQTASLKVFQPFFVDLLMPYSVVRGETFVLKATVFNYLKKCIQVRVNLAEAQQLAVKEACPSCQFLTCLCADEAKTFTWNVTATELGKVNISVTTEAEGTHELCGNRIAVTPTRGRSDTVVKPLLVKPEGIQEEETHNAFLCSSGDPVVEDVSLKLPAEVVEGSGRATVTAIGDVLGTALQNLEMLLQMPFGCGEQNMVKFVPNIFILQYLERTNQATPEIRTKATEYMQSGYQRQLLYKHDNGSYSAFGKKDREGNTWLTAFVARAFSQARAYVYVDPQHIQDAVSWLEEHQLPSGCFQNVGRLFNNALKGGVDEGLSLTAYVTASLLELHLEKNSSVVERALLCLKNNLTAAHREYSKALLAYVFTLAGDTETRQQLLQDLDQEADKGEGSIGWDNTETSAYVLLSLLFHPEVSPDDLSYSSQIVRSLAKEQNPYGGFSSTQDTVVALQALAKYAALTFREIEGVKVLVKSAQGFRHEFHVAKGNRLVLQQAALPNVPGQYQLEALGSGCVYMQSTLRYNIPPPKPEAFALRVETLPEECNPTSRKHFEVHLHVSYTGDRDSSNMALLEVNMLSGHIPVKQSVKKLQLEPQVKKVEFEPDKISIYLDWLDRENRHYHFSVEQEVEVVDLKAATAKVYDYYHPADFAAAEYNAPCSKETTKQDQH